MLTSILLRKRPRTLDRWDMIIMAGEFIDDGGYNAYSFRGSVKKAGEELTHEIQQAKLKGDVEWRCDCDAVAAYVPNAWHLRRLGGENVKSKGKVTA